MDKRNNKAAIYSLLVVSFAYFWSNFHRLSMGVTNFYYVSDMGLTQNQISSLGSVLFLTYGITQIPFGMFADKYGSKLLVQICIFISAIGTFIFGRGKTYTELLIGRIILGIGISGFYVPSLKLIKSWFDIVEYSTYVGLFISIGNVGSLMAAAPLQFILSKISINDLYKIVFVFSVILVFLSIFLKDEEKSENIVKEEKKSEPMSKYFIIFLISTCIYGAVYGGSRNAFQGLWGNIYYSKVFGYDLTLASVMMTLFSIGGIIFNSFTGVIADKIGRYKTFVSMSVLTVLFWIIMAISNEKFSVFLIGIIAFIMGGILSSTISHLFTLISEYTTMKTQATITSIQNTANFFGSAFITKYLGVLFEGSGANNFLFTEVFLFFGIMLSAITVFFIISKKFLDKSLKIK